MAALLGGMAAWEQAGYPVDSGSAVAPVLTPRPTTRATPVAGPLASATSVAEPVANVTTVVGPLISSADMPRITVQELKAKLDAGQAVVFDARPQSAYARKHIDGAISLPQDEVAARVAELPTDKQAVFYCT